MIKHLFYILILFAHFLVAENVIKIDNFIDNGDGTITFDVMIKNDEPIQGAEFNIFSLLGFKFFINSVEIIIDSINKS